MLSIACYNALTFIFNKKYLMPNSDVVQVSTKEKAAFLRAITAFINTNPEFINSPHGIKITRLKDVPIYNSHERLKRREVYFPIDLKEGVTIYQTFTCPEDPLDIEPSRSHSCLFEDHHDSIKMIIPENRLESQQFKYYKDIKNKHNHYNINVVVKKAAVYDYHTLQKKTEIIYKSTFFHGNPINEENIDCMSTIHKNLYWTPPIYQGRTKMQEIISTKKIELMSDAGLSLHNFFSTEYTEEAAWIMLLLLAELQEEHMVFNDIKNHNMCYSIHPHTELTNLMIAIQFVDIEGLHHENTPGFFVYTPGYIAPELFLVELSPEMQKALVKQAHSQSIDSRQEMLLTQAKNQLKQIRKNLGPIANVSDFFNGQRFTLASDIFAMAITIESLFEQNKLSPSDELKQLLIKMQLTDPAERPDLAYCFGLTSERNLNLAEYTFSEERLSHLRYHGNINRLLTLTAIQPAFLAEKMKEHIQQDTHFSQKIATHKPLLHQKRMTAEEICLLLYSEQWKKLHDSLKPLALSPNNSFCLDHPLSKVIFNSKKPSIPSESIAQHETTTTSIAPVVETTCCLRSLNFFSLKKNNKIHSAFDNSGHAPNRSFAKIKK